MITQNMFYIDRLLFTEERTFPESELITHTNFVVVLAEPGAGKSELMKSLAKLLETRMVSANVFRQMGAKCEGAPVVIDAFDELAKLEESGVHQLLAKVAKANPSHVIISSRSSEWNNTATSIFCDFVGHEPLVVRLCEFNELEQRQIYTHYTQRQDFNDFLKEVNRFDLSSILPNPQFLKMFADAFAESNGRFASKKDIYSQAVARLGREVNGKIKPVSALSVEQKVELISEVFAKVLLAGVEGVGVSEASENQMYPSLVGIVSSSTPVSIVLATRLFKPGDNPDHHQPVHKIIAEYCAANYFIKRVNTPSDTLSLKQLLSIIAPNSIVRNELRGLLGWMASLGDKSTQESLIKLDPYAVLANGDPSQLLSSSKVMLLSNLKVAENANPYFRREDSWRKFSVSGLLTEEVASEIKPLLLANGDGHLRGLLLELLASSQDSKWFVFELEQLLFAKGEDKHIRTLAHQCLLNLEGYDPYSSLGHLIDESSTNSLRLVFDTFKKSGFLNIQLTDLESFFKSCLSLYSCRPERAFGERYFIKALIKQLSQRTLESLLDLLSEGLSCTCGKEKYKCECRHGVSKIIGSLLDRYFEITKPPFDPLRVWGWINNLNFSNFGNTNDSVAVKTLREDHDLRQGIISHAFVGLTDREKIWQLRIDKFDGHYSHAGLNLNLKDHNFIADLAFETDNSKLWRSFIPSHNRHRSQDNSYIDKFRRHMRSQALLKPEFMKVWVIVNRENAAQDKQYDKKYNAKHRRIVRRRDKRDKQLHLKNTEYVLKNRSLIEGGNHWGCLLRFAELILNNPEDIEKEFGDESLIRSSLRNCLGFIKPYVPNIHELAELQCQSKFQGVEIILFAACLEIMRLKGNLEEVPHQYLVALRTNLNIGWDAVDEDEKVRIKAEIDRLIFPTLGSTETFLRKYVEPQLEEPKCKHPDVGLLEYDEIFKPLRATLSVEWLYTFNNLEFSALNTLFELAVEFGDRKELNKVIFERSSALLTKVEASTTDNEGLSEEQKFWFIRAFYFLDINTSNSYFEQLSLDKYSILLFENLSGRMNRSEHSSWPELGARKIERILKAFIDEWPKVFLPNSWGTSSPAGETAYRFIKDIVWTLSNDESDESIPVLERLLLDLRFVEFHLDLKSILAEQRAAHVLRGFEPPEMREVVGFLDNGAVVTVEGLREQIVQELDDYQCQILGGEFNTASRFYTRDKQGKLSRLGEVESVNIVAEYLSTSLKAKDISIVKEHETKSQNRIDITATKLLGGRRCLLVIEAKGQWHKELYSAASTQLYERYSIHPDAEQQGIYLVFWFGSDEVVANTKKHVITSAQELKLSIESTLPTELKGVIDVFVLDVSCS